MMWTSTGQHAPCSPCSLTTLTHSPAAAQTATCLRRVPRPHEGSATALTGRLGVTDAGSRSVAVGLPLRTVIVCRAADTDDHLARRPGAALSLEGRWQRG